MLPHCRTKAVLNYISAPENFATMAVGDHQDGVIQIGERIKDNPQKTLKYKLFD